MEAKFRGKSIKTGEWFEGSLIHDQDDNTYIGFIILHEKCLSDLPEDVMWSVTEVHPNSVGMYTGLKDKKGVEIYEGDIIEFNCGLKVETAVIEYQEHCYHAGFFPDKHTNGHMHWGVIGNTTDDPELLKK